MTTTTTITNNNNNNNNNNDNNNNNQDKTMIKDQIIDVIHVTSFENIEILAKISWMMKVFNRFSRDNILVFCS
jgi:hypothetical protein